MEDRFFVAGRKYILKSVGDLGMWEGDPQALIGQILTFVSKTHSFYDSHWAYEFNTSQGRLVCFTVVDGLDHRLDMSEHFAAQEP